MVHNELKNQEKNPASIRKCKNREEFALPFAPITYHFIRFFRLFSPTSWSSCSATFPTLSFRTPLLLHLNRIRANNKKRREKTLELAASEQHAHSTQCIVIPNASLYSVHKAATQLTHNSHASESEACSDRVDRGKSERDNRICAAAHQLRWQCMCSGHVFMVLHLVPSHSTIRVWRTRRMALAASDWKRWCHTVHLSLGLHTHTHSQLHARCVTMNGGVGSPIESTAAALARTHFAHRFDIFSGTFVVGAVRLVRRRVFCCLFSFCMRNGTFMDAEKKTRSKIVAYYNAIKVLLLTFYICTSCARFESCN